MPNNLIEVGTLVLNSATPDVNGAIWKVSSFDGWEAPTVRQTLLDLTGRTGSALGESFHGPLVVIIEGTCITTSLTAMWASQARLRSAASPSTSVLLKVHELPTTQAASVYLAGAVRMKLLPGAKNFRFELPLIAPDPTKAPV